MTNDEDISSFVIRISSFGYAMGSAFDYVFSRLGSPTLQQYAGTDVAIAFLSAEGAEPAPLSGVMVSVQASAEETGDEGRRQRLTQEITIPRLGNDCFAALDPVEGQIFTIAGTWWYVEAVLRSTTQLIDVKLFRGPSIESSQPGYRHR
jgi:hypothetical protein